MSGGQWLRTTGRDGLQHVVYLPERDRHTMRATCRCHPDVSYGVVTHGVTFISKASREH